MDKNFYNQLCIEEKELRNTLEAIQILKRRYAPLVAVGANEYVKSLPEQENTPNQHKDLFGNDSTGYDPKATIPKKVLFALSAITSGTSKEVGQKLQELDSSYSEEKAKKDARLYLSNLYIKKVIDVSEPGSGKKGHTYKIKAQQ